MVKRVLRASGIDLEIFCANVAPFLDLDVEGSTMFIVDEEFLQF